MTARQVSRGRSIVLMPKTVGQGFGSGPRGNTGYREGRGRTRPSLRGTDGRYGAGVASPVMASGGSTRMASRTAGSWPSLRISPATWAGM